MRRIPILLLSCLALLGACDQADCTLDNSVTYTCNFYAEGSKVTLNDIITVTACGTDSVLVNQKQGATRIELPMSYWNEEDTLVLRIQGSGYTKKNTIWIKKKATAKTVATG